MPWSIFSQGGGSGAAVTWAEDLQKKLGIPVNPVDTKVIYDWEVSEGGGGKFNPLNQGDVPGHPELTSTGSQFGGGAADYVSWDAGLQGAADYLNFSNYTSVLRNLRSQAPYDTTVQSIWNSPWASSHYGFGKRWSTAAVPGAAPLPISTGGTTGIPLGSTGTAGATLLSTDGSPAASSNPFSVWQLLGIPDPVDALERLGLIILGAILILLGVYMLAGKQVLEVTPLGRAAGRSREAAQRTSERQAREAGAEARRNRREQRQGEAGQRQLRALSLRERRIKLAEDVEKRKRGELGIG